MASLHHYALQKAFFGDLSAHAELPGDLLWAIQCSPLSVLHHMAYQIPVGSQVIFYGELRFCFYLC